MTTSPSNLRVDPVAVKRITPFVRPRIDPENMPPDYLALLSLVVGVTGLMTKVNQDNIQFKYTSNHHTRVALLPRPVPRKALNLPTVCCVCAHQAPSVYSLVCRTTTT